MKISINNYEAYLIDYMDGRLNDAEIRQLKAFCVQNHIDFEELTEDLPVLESTDDTFDEKEYLFKNKIVPFGSINEDNYEERFIAYQELILDGEEEREVEEFADKNPFLLKDLRIYGNCRLEPDTAIVFKDKENLKKKAVIFPLYAKIAAAVAVIAVLFGLFWLPKNEDDNANQQPVLVELKPEPSENILNSSEKENVISQDEEGRDVARYDSDDKQQESNKGVARNISTREQQIQSAEDVARNVSTEKQIAPHHEDVARNVFTREQRAQSAGDVARNVSTEFLAENESEEIQEIRPEQIGIEPELLATLTPKNASGIEVSKDFAIENGLLPERVFFLPMNDFYLAQNQEWDDNDDFEFYDEHPSLFDKGISWLSQGRYTSIGEAISDGLRIGRREVVELSEQAVAIAYIKADEGFNEIKTKLEERFERKEQ